MSLQWNPVSHSLQKKLQYYVINSVLNGKVFNVQKQKYSSLFLDDVQAGKDSQLFAFIKKEKGYLIRCKAGGYLTVEKDQNGSSLYVGKKDKKSQNQLFKISQKLGQQGYRIESIFGKAIGIPKAKQDQGNISSHDVVLTGQDSSLNQLWNFSDQRSLNLTSSESDKQ